MRILTLHRTLFTAVRHNHLPRAITIRKYTHGKYTHGHASFWSLVCISAVGRTDEPNLISSYSTSREITKKTILVATVFGIISHTTLKSDLTSDGTFKIIFLTRQIIYHQNVNLYLSFFFREKLYNNYLYF